MCRWDPSPEAVEETDRSRIRLQENHGVDRRPPTGSAGGNTKAVHSILETMSIVPKETIEVIAQSVGITNLSPDVSLALAPDVEYRLREIMQEAIKCMRHSRRTVLTAEDVDSALSMRNLEPLYGFATGDPLKFKRAVGHKDLFYLDDKDVDLKDIIEAPLPKAPLDTAVVVHWLAIEGVQPAIPENVPIGAIAVPSENKKFERNKDGLPVDIKLPVKHVLSRELQLHQLMPSMITCIVAKRLGNRLSDNHWELRDFAADLVASVCRSSLFSRSIEICSHQQRGHRVTVNEKGEVINWIQCMRYGHVYHNLQSRLTKTLFRAFLDTSKALTQHYGAIQGLAALGPSVVRLLVLPNLEAYILLLEPEMLVETQKNEMKRREAWHVYGALISLASNHHFSQQPPLKKQAVDGSLSSSSMISTTANPHSVEDGFSDNMPAEPGQHSSSSEQLSNNIILAGSSKPRQTSSILEQAWKEDLEAGRLLALLFELFGERIFSFIQPVELNVFL
ncbi:hypothetical protein AXF42_Ash001802 [Apostasia shenzhenica]|uniref:TATA box binding protein associated factor (TAF) histone-like fold domain-containing protein n=1 Tax=Apostasia shenzhenica TaxID=1088818 RepID=A0A2I0AB94_9ASPA|nr:hypothetical protein AXF42_Ash001802 [Apostasia shenzhenica]